MPKLSIITIVYNGAATMEATMQSMLEQVYTDYEYIIVDGASKDGTMELVRKYESLFQQKSIPVIISSEPDQGIYDAMNKGIAKASGEWLYFLNAGDVLYNPGVLANVEGQLDRQFEQIVYGDICSVDGKKQYIMKSAPDASGIEKNIPFCHQAVFIEAQTHRQHLYDLTYRLASDYEFFLWQYRNGARFKHIHTVIARFALDGESNSNRKQLFLEYHRIWKQYGITKSGLAGKLDFIWGYVKMSIARALPSKLVYGIMKKRINAN